MYSGYFQVVVEEDAREILASFTPDRKRRWKLMPMGVLNVAPMFVAIMVKLQVEWVTFRTPIGITFHRRFPYGVKDVSILRASSSTTT